MTSHIHKSIILITLLLVIDKSNQSVDDNNVDDEPSLADFASGLFANNGGQMGAITGMLGQFMQSDGGKEIGSMLLNGLSNNQEAAGDIISGIGNMVTQKDGSLDPQMIGTMINMFGSAMGAAGTNGDAKKDEPSLGSVLGDLISGFANQNANSQFNVQNLLAMAPMAIQTLSSFNHESNAQKQERAKEHADHAWFLPPVLEQWHQFLDYFVHSEFGAQLYRKFGVDKIIRKFSDENGQFDMEKLIYLFENHSFRRYWIQQATNYLANLVQYLADPQVQKKYFNQTQYLMNGYLKSFGFPHQTYFDATNPSESLTNLVNYASKRYFQYKVDAAPYVRPLVVYVADLVHMAHKESHRMFSFGKQTKEISHKLADTVNMEVLEPILRVFRAYRYARREPHCTAYVMCLINRNDQNDGRGSLPGLKGVLSKGTSLFASWFLSNKSNQPFWTLYGAIVNEQDCQTKFPVDCSEFHAEEVRVTTEYVHNEL